MKTSTLTRRSLIHYRRSTISVLLGTAVATSVLVGAMLVGDSVRYSLRSFALQRLGKAHFALQSRGRFFADALAPLLADKASTHTAPVLQLRGVALSDSRQVNHVQVLGVDQRFWALAPHEPSATDAAGAAISRKLAVRLGLDVGDEISVRIGTPSLLPRDAPLSSRKDDLSVRARLNVTRIVEDEELGRFGLSAEQIAPFNLFVDLQWLQQRVGLEGKANLLLIGQASHGQLTAADLQAALAAVWRPSHVGIRVRAVEAAGIVQLESDRIFFDPATARAAVNLQGAVGTLTYLVNSINRTVGDETLQTPYSFVVACDTSEGEMLSPVPRDMADNEIILSRWLSDQIRANPGDVLTMAYYELTPGSDFVEKQRIFRVRDVVEMADLARERLLTPEFPGLSDVESCSEWDVGMPMDEQMLADKANEAYWDRYRQTPKAFITLSAGQEMWANRFGDLSSVRFKAGQRTVEELETELTQVVDPAVLGFFFMPVREESLEAVSRAMDFGGLFLGMSFFLIVSSLMLTGLLFVFGVQQRAGEIGLLLAVGYSAGRVRLLLLHEAALISACGAFLGAWMGTFYTRVLIWALSAYWQGAVAGAAITYHGTWQSVMRGAVVSLVCALLAVTLAMWRLCRRAARELLAGEFTEALTARKAGRRGMLWLAGSSVLALLAVATAVAGARAGEKHVVTSFFGAGSLLLLAGLGFSRCILGRLAVESGGTLTVNTLGIRNTARRAGRSTAVVSLLACGCFMVLAVSSMQEDVTAHADARWSGTGGFAFFGQSTLPVADKLGRAEGRERFGLNRESDLEGVEIVSLKLYDGDDASCFNLNRALAPRLYGVDPEEFSRRHAFLPEAAVEDLWARLDHVSPDGSIPALVGDSDTAMWGLGKAVGPDGDSLVYRDERGELFNVKLVGKLPMRLSVFQGSVIVSDAAFTERFPSEEGYRAFLFDVPNGAEEPARAALEGRLNLVGMDITPCAERLREFYSVESTYMTMFLVLGGLGLLLGSVGMGLVVMRNVMERRGELAILRAVGYERSTVRRIVLVEHWLLLFLGILVGVVASAVAMWPSFHSPAVHVPYGVMLLILAGVTLFGLLCTSLAAWLATRGDLIPALRSE